MPAVTNPQFPPPWEGGPGPADPAISASIGSAYTGSGYGPNPQGQVGIGVSTPAVNNPVVATVQPRFYLQSDGNLYILDNKTGQAFMVAPSANVPRPPYYSPTK